jgi:hypothetical protein
VAFDEVLAERVQEALKGTRGVTERRMFGGLAFMLHGHMFVGIVDSVLMARVGPGEYEAALSKQHVREMDFTGKPMRGYVFVDPPGTRTAKDLAAWITKCISFVSTLPGKRKG